MTPVELCPRTQACPNSHRTDHVWTSRTSCPTILLLAILTFSFQALLPGLGDLATTCPHVAELGCSPLTYCLPQTKAGHSKTEEERVWREDVADATSRVTQVQQKDSLGVCVGTGTLSCGHQKPGSPWQKQPVGLQNRKASGVFWPGGPGCTQRFIFFNVSI